MKTKTVTVYWSEIVHMKNTIEVPIDWTEKDIENDPDGIMFNGAKDIGCEIETDSIEIEEHDQIITLNPYLTSIYEST